MNRLRKNHLRSSFSRRRKYCVSKPYLDLCLKSCQFTVLDTANMSSTNRSIAKRIFFWLKGRHIHDPCDNRIIPSKWSFATTVTWLNAFKGNHGINIFTSKTKTNPVIGCWFRAIQISFTCHVSGWSAMLFTDNRNQHETFPLRFLSVLSSAMNAPWIISLWSEAAWSYSGGISGEIVNELGASLSSSTFGSRRVKFFWNLAWHNSGISAYKFIYMQQRSILAMFYTEIQQW